MSVRGHPNGQCDAATGMANAGRDVRPLGFVIASDECYSEIYFGEENHLCCKPRTAGRGAL